MENVVANLPPRRSPFRNRFLDVETTGRASSMGSASVGSSPLWTAPLLLSPPLDRPQDFDCRVPRWLGPRAPCGSSVPPRNGRVGAVRPSPCYVSYQHVFQRLAANSPEPLANNPRQPAARPAPLRTGPAAAGGGGA